MRKSHIPRSVVAAMLTLAVLLSGLPPAARAATSSEIKEEITDLKVENAVIQAQIDAVRSQYNANASEIQALVDKKNAVDAKSMAFLLVIHVILGLLELFLIFLS